MNPDIHTIVPEIFAGLEDAWNHADGARWGEAFSEDADFVNVQGLHFRGAAAVAAGHQRILDSIYLDSKVRYSVVSSALIADRCLLGIVEARLDVPAGPLQGSHPATITAVVVDAGDGVWKVRSFHNTLVTG
jgi:uncharacterized protein (TIGR02246 family)